MATAKTTCRLAIAVSVLISFSSATCKYNMSEGQLSVVCRKEKVFPSGIPPNVFSIDLSDCRIKHLSRNDLSNFTQLTSFKIAGNRMQTMDPEAFSNNLLLQSLDISRNPLISSNVTANVLCNVAKVNVHVKELYLSVTNINRDNFPDILRCLEKLKLYSLDLSATKVGELKDYTFSKMTSLLVLKLGSITPVNLRALVNLTLLNTLRLSDTGLNQIPNFIDPSTNRTLLPNLTALYLDKNEISTLPWRPVGLDDLEFLSLRANNLIRVQAEDMASFAPKLSTLFLNSNKGIHMDKSDFGTSLVDLELRDCRIKFSYGIRNVFHNMTRLVGLSLTKNYMDDSDDVLGVVFNGLTSLTHLSLEECTIRRLPPSMFRGLSRLEMLTLRGNKITTLSRDTFRDLHSLQRLILAQNSLTIVPEGVISSLLPTLERVDFAGNPFVCSCDLLGFMKLFRSNRPQFDERQTFNAYVCRNPPKMQGVNLTSFAITDADCRHLSLPIKLTITFSCLICFILVLAAVVYRLRWYIGYVYFVLRARRREAREQNTGRCYPYDAFVVYNQNDVTWVRDRLLPVLENEAGLRLCLHERDWLCGVDIVDNIVQSIESSRKTLLVVSNAFASSQWCQLELTLAQHRLLAEDRNALILILLEPIVRQHVTPRLLLQMRQQTYLEWTEDAVGERMFWKKLKRSLQKSNTNIAQTPPSRQPPLQFAEEDRDALLPAANENAGDDEESEEVPAV